MSELAPTQNHDQVLNDFEAAQAAAQPNGNTTEMELGSATNQLTTLESVGNVVEGPFVQRVTEVGNTEVNQDQILAQNVNSHVKRYGEDDSRTAFEFNTAGIVNPDTGIREYGRITRRGPSGEYEHRFKDPETARKFGSLISKQVARREQSHDGKIAA